MRPSTDRLIVISTGSVLYRIPADKLVYVEAEGNYSTVATQDNRKTFVSLQLGQVEDLFFDQLGDNGCNFVRLGRSLIINTDFFFSLDTGKKEIVLSDCHGYCHTLKASREVLTKFKTYLEAAYKE